MRNQAASNIIHMIQTHHELDIVLQEVEPILSMSDMDTSSVQPTSPTIHQNQQPQDPNVSNTTQSQNQSASQAPNVLSTTPNSQESLSWQERLSNALNEYHSGDSDDEDFLGKTHKY